MKKVFYIFFCLVLLLVSINPSISKQADHSYILTILHTNDLHGQILPHVNSRLFPPPRRVGGAAHKAALIASFRKFTYPVLLLDAGDIAQGTPISNYFYGEPVIKVMNQLKYDALTLGNHDFDWGTEVLTQIIRQAKFPVLAANIRHKTTHQLFPGTLPYIIKQIGNIKIGIVGVITPDTPFITKQENIINYNFLSPSYILPSIINKLHSNNVDLIVLLSHLGVDKDRELALAVKGIDVIVGGHSHTPLTKAIIERNTIIVQAGSYGDYLGKLTLYLDKHKKILQWTSHLISIEEGRLREDPNIAAILSPYKAVVAPIMAEVIGEASKNILKGDKGESALGNFICDALRNSTQSEIAFYNSGGIRSDFLKGSITMESVFTALPFDNKVVTMKISGAEILNILEHSVYGQQGVMQISGITSMKYDSSRPQGERVIEVRMGNKLLNYQKQYKIVTNDFLANGGDRYRSFKNGKQIQYNETVRELIAQYIKKHSPISAQIEGRIVDISIENSPVLSR